MFRTILIDVCYHISINFGNLAREVAKLAGGSGGGKPDSAMAGAKDVAALPEAITKAEEILSSMIK